MMGSSAAYDMAQAPEVELVTLVDRDLERATDAARRMNRLSHTKKIRAVKGDAARSKTIVRLMRQHDAALSCVPYFLNLDLAKSAIDAGCHFADLGGNDTVVRQELALEKKAVKAGVSIAPDCGLSPGMASILAGELMRRMGGRADALEIYVGGLPAEPRQPFSYQLVFSAEGLINEYVEPCRILRKGKVALIEPLSEPEVFVLNGFPPLEAFQTSGGTSTLADSFQGKVGECFEKTLRYHGHFAMIRALYDLGLFSSQEMKLAKGKVVPRRLMTKIFEEKFAGHRPDVVILRVEAHTKDRQASFTVVDRFDAHTKITAMMRTTAWSASVVVQMLASGQITKTGAILQELDVPFDRFLAAMTTRGIPIEFEDVALDELPAEDADISAGA
jgi:lysine 6-dehydrogenase